MRALVLLGMIVSVVLIADVVATSAVAVKHEQALLTLCEAY